MPSLQNTLLAVAAALAATVQADYQISPDSVSLSTRQYWCANERSTCPIICSQTPPYSTLENTCDPETLTYGCLCGDGLQPNVSEYSLTLPYFTCQEWGNQCVKACGLANNECSSDCRQNNPCGALNPSHPNTTTTTSATTASGTSNPTQIYTGLAGGGSNSDAGTNLAPSLDAGRHFGFVLLMGGLVAGVAWML